MWLENMHSAILGVLGGVHQVCLKDSKGPLNLAGAISSLKRIVRKLASLFPGLATLHIQSWRKEFWDDWAG